MNMDGQETTTMRRLPSNGNQKPRPLSWSAIPADDPATHQQIIKFLSESIVDNIQSNISNGFIRQVHASKKSAMPPQNKAERMRIVRDMRTTLDRLTEELGQKFFEEYRHRPAVGRWYDSWLLNEPPQLVRWEHEWAFTSDEALAMAFTRSNSSSVDGRVSVAENTPETVPEASPETTPEIKVEFAESVEDCKDIAESLGVPEYRPDAPVTEKKADIPVSPSIDCRCKHSDEDSDLRSSPLCQTCICSEQGQGCIASCGCDETCQNNFNNIALDKILGIDASGRSSIHACSIAYLQKHDLLVEPITLDYLFDELLPGLDYVPDGNDEAIDAWRVEWKTIYTGPDPDGHMIALQRELIRLGLGADRGDMENEWFFSFCYNSEERIGSWQSGHQIWHCKDCGTCSERQEWHCEECNKCQYERSEPCGDCGGVSHSYHEHHDECSHPS